MSIDYEQDAHIVTITINRPDTRNSLDMEHFRDLAHAWAAFRDDDTAWAAVVTGVGRDFCTGADLKQFIPELAGDLPQPTGGTNGTRSMPSCITSRCTSRSSPL